MADSCNERGSTFARGRSAALALFGGAALLVCATADPAHAQVGSARYSSIIVDDATGKVLEAVNVDELRYPASLTKLMTLYLAFEALRDRRITLNDVVPVSPHAASMQPSKLGLVPGTNFTVEQAIYAIVTKSANDAACALGEFLGGDEPRFAQMMTLRARALGMSRSNFRNASGLPDPEQTTTARDLAVLAHHLIRDFPDEYHYFSTPSFTFHGRAIYNHDHLLQSYEGADGLKTGYTEAAGHNLVTSAVRSGVRLIGVVMGAGSNAERDIHMANLLDGGFEHMDVQVARREERMHMPALIASASAATLHSSARFRYASARFPMHGHAGRHMTAQAMVRPVVAEFDAPAGRPHRAHAAHKHLTRTVSADPGSCHFSKRHGCSTLASR
ncbi:MAG TPA: D-alanyl-D-alanine carboxypeptidase family protein [Acetobacteraceae bacterium]|nr:D-alanyl-D-alanine carboxypeptidase family protein [Acetobacteraceae bacterium]